MSVTCSSQKIDNTQLNTYFDADFSGIKNLKFLSTLISVIDFFLNKLMNESVGVKNLLWHND